MTDMQRFIELYKSFGIELPAEKVPLGYEITFESGSHDKFGGYSGFGTVVEFDDAGTFRKQTFWE
jgi:hypothetical protein